MINFLFSFFHRDPLVQDFRRMLSLRRATHRLHKEAGEHAVRQLQALHARDNAKDTYFEVKQKLESDINTFPF